MKGYKGGQGLDDDSAIMHNLCLVKLVVFAG